MSLDYHVGDVRDVMASIPDGTIDLIASSPPFLALRSYLPAGHEHKHAEIGSEANPAAFLDTLLALTAEWGRVLAAHGSLAIELGDTYSGSGGGGGDYLPGGLRENQQQFAGSASASMRESNAAHWRQKNQKVDKLATYDDARGNPAGMRDTTFQGGNTRTGSGPSWPNAKSLALIPQLYAVALAYGINPLTGQPSPAGRWLVRNVIVWHRPNPAVGALGDKYRPSTSYIVVATRSAKRWFDLTAVRTEAIDQRARSTNGQKKGPVDEVLCSNYDQRVPSHAAGAPPLDAWFDEYDGEHDTWTLTTQPSRLSHYAMWPAKLAERLILSMCPREVCTICGEPRRRVETSAYVPHGPKRDELKSVRGMGVQNGEHAQAMEHGRATKIPTTLGWTNCGCKCPTCRGEGKYRLKTMYDDDWTYCRDCTDGQAFRSGVILDPFAGTGTTLAVADLHDRDAIGIDIDARNRDLLPARINECRRALFGTPIPDPAQMELAL